MLRGLNNISNTISHPVNDVRKIEYSVSYVVNFPQRMIGLWNNVKNCCNILCPCWNNDHQNVQSSEINMVRYEEHQNIDLIGDVHHHHLQGDVA
jgi:hypothetical protein